MYWLFIYTSTRHNIGIHLKLRLCPLDECKSNRPIHFLQLCLGLPLLREISVSLKITTECSTMFIVCVKIGTEQVYSGFT